MKMTEVRTKFGVPAKRGGYVQPKPGRFMAGHTGKITGTTNTGHLRVKNLGTELQWGGTYAPDALEYLDADTVRRAGFR